MDVSDKLLSIPCASGSVARTLLSAAFGFAVFYIIKASKSSRVRNGYKTNRERSSRPGLADRKRYHHARVLSALAECPDERLQPEVESRSCDAVRRRRGARCA